MSLIRLLAVSIVFGCVAGCASSYKLRPGAPTAEFSVASQTDSEHTTLTTTNAMAHDSETSCESKYGRMLAKDFGNSNSGQSKSVQIAANETFWFTASYGESRFAQNRNCALTASFKPVAGHRYRATIVAQDQVAACSLGIYDVTSGTEQRIEFEMPKLTCAGEPNGRPIWTVWEVRSY